MRVRDLIFGRPIATEEADDETVSAVAGVPVLGLDALASAAYGPEALLTVLLPLGVDALRYLWWLTPITLLVLALLYASYMQTIPAYPGGGGAYTVAKENLGCRSSLLAAASLATDYILNVAVGIAAGVGALVSALPELQPYTLVLCFSMLAFLTLVNLRGVRSTGLAFLVPTYLFVACMAITIAWGTSAAIATDFHPTPVIAPPHPKHAVGVVSFALLLRAFANGCTALTGVEAVSNGVPIFKKPTVTNARRALTLIVAVLAFVLLGEAVLCKAYGVLATQPGEPGFQSVLSLLISAVAGRGAFYAVAMCSVISVLLLSANTSFADFPRLCRVLATDGFLPEPFVHRGRRLVFSYGVLLLSALSAVLLLVFDGVTDRLIPLFAIGALAAFTASQLGMVVHWRRQHEARARRALVFNALGAAATCATLIVVLVAKFREGAWITIVLAGALTLLLLRVRAHYDRIQAQTEPAQALDDCELGRPRVLVPLRRWDAPSIEALRLALRMGEQVVVVQVLTQDRSLEDLRERWESLVAEPARRSGFGAPELIVLQSEYRDLYGPLIQYVRRLAGEAPTQPVAVLIPELVEPRWYHYLLHNHTPTMLRTMLMRHAGPRVLIVTAPWRLAP